MLNLWRRLRSWLRLHLWPLYSRLRLRLRLSRKSLRLRLRSGRLLRSRHSRLLRLTDHSLRHLLRLIRRRPRSSWLRLRSWLCLRWRQSSHLWLRARNILLRALVSISCSFTLGVRLLRDSRLLAIGNRLLTSRLSLRLLLSPNACLLKLLLLAGSHGLRTRLHLLTHLLALSLLPAHPFSTLRLKLLALKTA